MKKFILSTSLIVFTLFATAFSSYALTTHNENLDAIGNSVKNIIGGAENKVEDTAKDAANAGKNATNSIGDAAGKAGENIKNSAQNASDAMKNGTQNMENSMEKGTQNAGNAIKDGAQNVGNTLENVANNITNPGNYNAERTSAENQNAGDTFMNSTTWAWIIIGIIAVAIIALFWYYMVQSRK